MRESGDRAKWLVSRCRVGDGGGGSADLMAAPWVDVLRCGARVPYDSPPDNEKEDVLLHVGSPALPTISSMKSRPWNRWPDGCPSSSKKSRLGSLHSIREERSDNERLPTPTNRDGVDGECSSAPASGAQKAGVCGERCIVDGNFGVTKPKGCRTPISPDAQCVHSVCCLNRQGCLHCLNATGALGAEN